MLDALDQRAPLQIQAAARHRGPQTSGQWAETVNEHPLGDAGDRVARAAAAFVAAVRAGDASKTNAAEMANAALVWETARASMTRGGELLPLSADGVTPEMRRPELQVIQRRRARRSTDHPAPELTLVARGDAAAVGVPRDDCISHASSEDRRGRTRRSARCVLRRQA